MTPPADGASGGSAALARVPPVWAQAGAVAALWVLLASLGGVGDDFGPRGAAAAAGLALVAANVSFPVPRNLLAGVAPALVVAGASTGVLATGPALGGDAATAVYVAATLLALTAATAPRQPASLALVPAVAVAARAAPGVNTALGLGVVAVAVAVAVVVLVTSGEQRPHREAPWGAAVVAVGLGLLTFPLLDSAAVLLLAAGVLAVAAQHPLALVTALPGAAVATELLVVVGIPGREQAAGVLAAVALVLAASAAARELDVRALPRSVREVSTGTWPAAFVGLWLVLGPQSWGWTSLTVPTVLVLDGYVDAVSRAAAGGMLAVALALVWRVTAVRAPDGTGR